MTTDQRIAQVISGVFSVPLSEIDDTFSQDSTDKWTSLAHLTLVLSLEEEFQVSFSDQETVEMLNFKLIRATLHDKGIE